MHISPERIEELHAALTDALRSGELQLYFQPEIDLQTRKVVRREALLRWESPTLGWVEPSEFLPAAEASNLIVEIGAWVLETACNEAHAWPNETVCVNVSKRQLFDSKFVALVARSLEKAAFPAHRLCLEIAASTLLADVAESKAVLASLQTLGVAVAIDNFGSDALARGSEFSGMPFDSIKTDFTLMRDIGSVLGQLRDEKLLADIARFGSAAGVEVIATGVETGTQDEFLKTLDFATGQGFYFGRPQPMRSRAPMKLIA